MFAAEVGIFEILTLISGYLDVKYTATQVILLTFTA